MNNFLKFLFLILFFLFWLFSFQINNSFASDSQVKNIYFIVTAYYSPLPNQKHYITWTYAWDIRLNWKWHTTASGKTPFAGVLAAPTKYPFWTKIYFEWYWVWVVEDRWWAIVKAWVRGQEHDRIDIWMWYGDEGLQRALKWGKRTLKWRVVSRSQPVNLKFTKDILAWLEKIKVNPEKHQKEDVIKLQEKFKELWLYNWEIDWNYNSLKKALIDFQLKNKIISSYKDEAAWWFWPKTYVALLRRYWNRNILIPQKDFIINETSSKIEIILEAPEIKLNWDNPQKEEVIKVQNLFKKIWLYNWPINWDYNSIKNIILDIQKKAGIIKKDNDWWAWYFWEKTKAALIEYLENEYEQSLLTPKEKITLNKLAYKIKKYIQQKAKNNEVKQRILKRKLENKLTQIWINTKNEKLKYKINYLIKNI